MVYKMFPNFYLTGFIYFTNETIKMINFNVSKLFESFVVSFNALQSWLKTWSWYYKGNIQIKSFKIDINIMKTKYLLL